MSTIATHFSVWLTVDTSCLPSSNIADVTVLRDERSDDESEWISTSEQHGYWPTTVVMPNGDHDDAIAQADAAMQIAGWVRVGDWKPVPTGYIATARQNTRP